MKGKSGRNQPRDMKEHISFRKLIPAGTTDVLHERIKASGTIEGARIRFYQGQQLSLKVNIFVEKKGGLMEQLTTYPSTTDQFISGDDEVVYVDCVVSVENDEYIKVRVENTDAQDNYNVAVDVYIDYYAGTNRVIGGVL